jgi:uncharacterized protein
VNDTSPTSSSPRDAAEAVHAWTGFLPLVAANELGADPVRVHTHDGEALVLYRDASGKPALLSDRCPHRFASLADGRVRSDGRLACPYHGWHFDSAGCGKSPTQPERTDCDTIAYEVIEQAGGVWAAPAGAKQAERPSAALPALGKWLRRSKRGLLRKRPEEPDALSFPVQVATRGFRSFVVRERIVETKDIVSWVLVPKDQKPVPHHAPGQHVSIRLPALGTLVRSYSLSAPSNGKSLRISVRRVPAEGRGIASNHMHAHVHVGAELELSAPAGEFILPERDRPSIFVASGVGITPLFCMLMSRKRYATPAWLLYGVRTKADVFRPDELRALARAGVHIKIFMSGESGTDTGQDADTDAGTDVLQWARGRVQPGALTDLLSQGPDVFLCGPEEMMGDFEAELDKHPTVRVHSERFVRSNAIADAAKDLSAATVTFKKSGRTVSWSPQSGTLLELAVNAGIALDSGCQVGSCSTCSVSVLEGAFLTVGKTREANQPRACLVCVSVPTGDLVLDA